MNTAGGSLPSSHIRERWSMKPWRPELSGCSEEKKNRRSTQAYLYGTDSPTKKISKHY